MANYFGKFPIIPYSINKTSQGVQVFDLATDILIRLRVMVEKLDEVFHYYEYTIKDGETPEILANKVYGDIEAHWLILMTNNLTDPFYDWPLSTTNFNNYLIQKYGSVEYAESTPHHWEAIYTTYDPYSRTSIEKTYIIQSNPISEIQIINAGSGYANGYMNVATDYGYGANISFTVDGAGALQNVTINSGGTYIASPNVVVLGANTVQAFANSFVATGNLWSSLPTDLGSYTSQNVNGFAVDTYPAIRNMVTIYDWEFSQNEAKRQIKLIKPEYFSGIRAEFNSIMQNAQKNPVIPGIRTVT